MEYRLLLRLPWSPAALLKPFLDSHTEGTELVLSHTFLLLEQSVPSWDVAGLSWDHTHAISLPWGRAKNRVNLSSTVAHLRELRPIKRQSIVCKSVCTTYYVQLTNWKAMKRKKNAVITSFCIPCTTSFLWGLLTFCHLTPELLTASSYHCHFLMFFGLPGRMQIEPCCPHVQIQLPVPSVSTFPGLLECMAFV